MLVDLRQGCIHYFQEEPSASPRSDDSALNEMEERLEVIDYLQHTCQNIDPKDTMTAWMLRKITVALDIKNCPAGRTERTVDVYWIVPFAKLPIAGLRYGEGSSRADEEDKKRRGSTSSMGKKVDFNHFLGTRELATGENAGYKPLISKVEADFISCVKCTVAQMRALKGPILASLDSSNIVPPSDIKEMLAQLALPFFLVDGMMIHFFCVFLVGEELFAFKDFASVNLAKLDSDVIVALDLAQNFFLYEVL
ncbi:hypothetical protein HDU86_005068 [Geranomyces michiganensis]|nr:hypothetical protein HDU86_005068 [Geranomyces michiganensis]